MMISFADLELIKIKSKHPNPIEQKKTQILHNSRKISEMKRP